MSDHIVGIDPTLDPNPADLPDLTGIPDPEPGKADAPTEALGFAAAAPGAARQLLARYVSWLRTQVGRTEDPAGSNRVTLHLAGADRDLWGYVRPSFQGSPWCAATPTGGLLQFGVDLRKLFPNGNSFYCPWLESMAKDRGVWRTGDYSPQTGDLSLMDDGHTGHATHVETSAPDASDYAGYRQIGGNTSPGNAGSQNNGGGVWLRDRARSVIRGWIDMGALLEQMQAEGLTDALAAGNSNAPAKRTDIAPGWRRVDKPYVVDTAKSCDVLSVAALNRALAADGAAEAGVKAHTQRDDLTVKIVLASLYRIGLVTQAYYWRGIAGTDTQAAIDTFRHWVGPSRGWTEDDMTGTVGIETLEMLFYDAGVIVPEVVA